jgi:hypothetical protein
MKAFGGKPVWFLIQQNGGAVVEWSDARRHAVDETSLKVDP